MQPRPYNPNTPQWTFFSWTSFAMAVTMMTVGLWHLPTDAWVRGYLVMGVFFLVGSTFTLSKTIRDNQEFKDRESQYREFRSEDRPVPLVLGVKEA